MDHSSWSSALLRILDSSSFVRADYHGVASFDSEDCCSTSTPAGPSRTHRTSLAAECSVVGVRKRPPSTSFMAIPNSMPELIEGDRERTLFSPARCQASQTGIPYNSREPLVDDHARSASTRRSFPIAASQVQDCRAVLLHPCERIQSPPGLQNKSHGSWPAVALPKEVPHAGEHHRADLPASS